MELTYRQIRALVVAGGRIAENLLRGEFSDAFQSDPLPYVVAISAEPGAAHKIRIRSTSTAKPIADVYVGTKAVEMIADPLDYKVEILEPGGGVSVRRYKDLP
jgi:hypothetical protein